MSSESLIWNKETILTQYAYLLNSQQMVHILKIILQQKSILHNCHLLKYDPYA